MREKPRVVQVGGERRERRELHVAVGWSARDERLVPVDLHVRANAHVVVSRGELAGEIDDDRLVLARRESDARRSRCASALVRRAPRATAVNGLIADCCESATLMLASVG